MLGGIIKKLLGGDEGGANMKEINPYVEQAKSEFDKLQGISNDELRAKSDLFRKRLKDHVSEEEKTLQELGQKAEDSATPISEKEQLYAEIDKLKKQIDTKLEEVLENSSGRVCRYKRNCKEVCRKQNIRSYSNATN